MLEYLTTLEDFLALLQQRLNRRLVDSESFRRARHIATSFPGSVLDFVGFERRLGQKDAGADFAVSLAHKGIEWLQTSRRWPQIRRLVENWRGQFSPEPHTVWLEFDTSFSHAARRAPNVFFSLDRDREAVPLSCWPSYAAMANALSAATFSGGGGLRACIEACPPSVTRIQVGIMLARNVPSFRLCLMPLDYGAGIEFLRAIDWPGNLTSAANAMRQYQSLCDQFALQVDVCDRVSASVGVELLYGKQPWENQPAREPRWAVLFDRLIRERLCSRCERDDLFGWVSQTSYDAPLIERLIDGTFPSSQKLLHGSVQTGLHHVKLVLDERDIMRAKAYFGAALAPAPLTCVV